MESLKIITAKKSDIPLILSFIKELAEVEKFPFDIEVTETDLAENLFGKHLAAEVLIFYQDELPAGFAVFYQTFSTTKGKPGLHLDDLYVRPNFQGKGIGKKALAHIANIAKERGCSRFEWWALAWNDKAISFYEKLGARKMKELKIFRLEGEEIDNISKAYDK